MRSMTVHLEPLIHQMMTDFDVDGLADVGDPDDDNDGVRILMPIHLTRSYVQMWIWMLPMTVHLEPLIYQMMV